MFSENIEIIKNSFTEVKGSGMYLALFFISVLYICLTEKNKNIKFFLGYFPVITLFIILNPLFNKCIDFVLDESVYWRMFWLLPIGVSTTYACVKLIEDRKQKLEKVLVLVAVIFIIMSSGKFIYTEQNYIKVDNWYKIPDEAKLIADGISQDSAKFKKVMLPETLVPYIRQKNADIELTYGRQPETYEGNTLLKELKNGNVEYVTTKCKEIFCNFIVIERSVFLSGNMEDYGYRLFAQTETYDIYKSDEVI